MKLRGEYFPETSQNQHWTRAWGLRSSNPSQQIDVPGGKWCANEMVRVVLRDSGSWGWKRRVQKEDKEVGMVV